MLQNRTADFHAYGKCHIPNTYQHTCRQGYFNFSTTIQHTWSLHTKRRVSDHVDDARRDTYNTFNLVKDIITYIKITNARREVEVWNGRALVRTHVITPWRMNAIHSHWPPCCSTTASASAFPSRHWGSRFGRGRLSSALLGEQPSLILIKLFHHGN